MRLRNLGAALAVASAFAVFSGGAANAVAVEPSAATTAVVTPTQQLTGATRPVPVRGDFDGDGRDDIFWYIAGSGTDYLWSGKDRSSGTLSADRFDIQTLNISGTYVPAVGDFDGDGRDDIFWYGPKTLPDTVWYFTGRGTVASKSVKINGSYTLHVGNLNTTGTSATTDDVFLYGAGAASLWAGTTTRTFTVNNYSSPPPSSAKVYVGNWRQSPTTVGAAVHQDLLFYRAGTASDVIWVGNGTGTFTTSAVTINGTYNPIVGNFDATNGPEMTDIFWYAPGTAKDSVWMNTGSSFTSVPQTVNGTSYKPVIVASNTTGAQDSIFWNNPSGADYLWKTTGSTGTFAYNSRTVGQFGATDPGGRTPLLGDFTTTSASSGGDLTDALDAAQTHSCALTTTGGVKCWGNNTQGNLGDGGNLPQSSPVDVTGLTTGVTKVVTGYFHSCALTSGGGVKCWGYNMDGQVGDGTNNIRRTPVNVSGLTSGVVDIAAGDYNTCALLSGGTVKCWGNNDVAQLGNGVDGNSNVPVNVTGLSGVASITLGQYHACAVTTTGGAKCWGYNGYGALGDGTQTNRSSPTNVSGLTTGVASLSAGGNHTCAVTTSGAAKCWGENTYGGVGDGTLTERAAPVAVSGLTDGVASIASGDTATCAITTAGAAKCWGENAYGMLGDGTETTRTTPVDVVGLDSGVAAIAVGQTHTCALLASGTLRCAGSGSIGKLGNGSTTSSSTMTDAIGTFGPGIDPGTPGNIDLLWWSPGNAGTQTEILWAELESVS